MSLFELPDIPVTPIVNHNVRKKLPFKHPFSSTPISLGHRKTNMNQLPVGDVVVSGVLRETENHDIMHVQKLSEAKTAVRPKLIKEKEKPVIENIEKLKGQVSGKSVPLVNSKQSSKLDARCMPRTNDENTVETSFKPKKTTGKRGKKAGNVLKPVTERSHLQKQSFAEDAVSKGNEILPGVNQEPKSKIPPMSSQVSNIGPIPRTISDKVGDRKEAAATFKASTSKGKFVKSKVLSSGVIAFSAVDNDSSPALVLSSNTVATEKTNKPRSRKYPKSSRSEQMLDRQPATAQTVGSVNQSKPKSLRIEKVVSEASEVGIGQSTSSSVNTVSEHAASGVVVLMRSNSGNIARSSSMDSAAKHAQPKTSMNPVTKSKEGALLRKKQSALSANSGSDTDRSSKRKEGKASPSKRRRIDVMNNESESAETSVQTGNRFFKHKKIKAEKLLPNSSGEKALKRAQKLNRVKNAEQRPYERFIKSKVYSRWNVVSKTTVGFVMDAFQQSFMMKFRSCKANAPNLVKCFKEAERRIRSKASLVKTPKLRTPLNHSALNSQAANLEKYHDEILTCIEELNSAVLKYNKSNKQLTVLKDQLKSEMS